MSFLNLISLIGIFGLCAIAWLCSENRNPKYFPWRVVILGIVLQLLLGVLIFVVPRTRDWLQVLSALLNVVFDAADAGARFIFGPILVPIPGQESLLLAPLAGGVCPPTTAGEVVAGFCGIQFDFVFAIRALPAVIFFSALVGLLYNLGILQVITTFFAKIFYSVMRLSGAESLSGAANIFVGIESAIVVRPFLSRMTRSELCAILTCCFGTAASSTLAIYTAFLRPVFPNILGHLVSASIMAIPACFVLSKILVPETEVPLTAGGIPTTESLAADGLGDGTIEDPLTRTNPMDATIAGALDGLRMAASIAAVLIAVLGLVYLVNQLFVALASLADSNINFLRPIGNVFSVITLQTILGALFLPLTLLSGVSLNWEEVWQSSVLIGQRLFQTEIPSYQALAVATALPEGVRVISDRAMLMVSYALSGFAHLASVGIFVGGISALAPSRRREIAALGWKALFAGTLATYMIACVAGVFDTGNPSILGRPVQPAITAPTPIPGLPSPAQPIAPETPAAPSP
ncbi:MAG: nucleoside:proton symporter [Synechococcales cyanobacterium C42_A2020_086]|jgi:CNT family concentrative nucleoside transporter|nr:nucleoside:proton symporter [Synechococcales cyanobacterium M58_A2018_015]MBF2074736.1 nucleoside:proton symporter [Synechococcales cyanobacterium C42_A2020_086]